MRALYWITDRLGWIFCEAAFRLWQSVEEAEIGSARDKLCGWLYSIGNKFYGVRP